MRVLIKEDENKIAQWTAQHLIEKINDFGPTQAKPFVLGLPTGSSPIATYNELIRRNKLGDISFKHVITFNMDEYIGIPLDHPQSYHSFMHDKLFNHIDIPSENINILNPNAPDLEKVCRDYEKKIFRSGGIDIFLGGLGTDGHIAFNEPGSSLTSRTRVKSLSYDTIQANSRFFKNDSQKVPTKALTVGVGTIMEAREVLLIVSGFRKARALRQIVEGSVSHMWPASILQMHQKCILICDEPATEELQVQTVNYFNDIERISSDGC